MNTNISAALRVAVAIAAVGATSACATVVRGTKEDYRVESTPPSARVTTSHGFSCTTPCTMKLPRKSEFDITVALDGFKDFSMHIRNEFSGAGAAGMAGNVILGGVIGIGVDAMSGATQDLKPNPLVVVLAPNGSSEESRAAEVVEAPK